MKELILSQDFLNSITPDFDINGLPNNSIAIGVTVLQLLPNILNSPPPPKDTFKNCNQARFTQFY